MSATGSAGGDGATSAEVTLAATVTECGDELRGEVRARGRGPATVRLRYRTAGAGPVDRGGPGVRIDLSAGAAFFTVKVPARGPISMVGRTFAIAWELEVVDGTDAGAVLASVPVTVLPAGGTAVWARRAGAPTA